VPELKLAHPKGSVYLLDIAITFSFFLANGLGVEEIPFVFLMPSPTSAIYHGCSSQSIMFILLVTARFLRSPLLIHPFII
jgi:hypothetical protein